MKYIIEIPGWLAEKVDASIAKGQYRNLEQFILVALQNQSKAELEQTNPWETSTQVSDNTSRADSPQMDSSSPRMVPQESMTMPLNRVITLDYPNDRMLSDGPLWGQYYRFLPAKVAVRILANMSRTSLANYNDLRESGAMQAAALNKVLSRVDKVQGRRFGEALTTGFPDFREKSKIRYMNQYLAYLSPKRDRLHGLTAKMRWLNIEAKGKKVEVGLTELGLRFCKLPSPVLDGEGDEPLSKQEKEFILTNIVEQLPPETLHMKFVLGEIESGVTSRTQLNDRLAPLYKQHWRSLHNWNPGVINTMRAGVTSRLFELGLIAKDKDGLMISYKLTEEGNAWLRKNSGPNAGAVELRRKRDEQTNE